jgi:hypothetical protein
VPWLPSFSCFETCILRFFCWNAMLGFAALAGTTVPKNGEDVKELH